LNLEKHFYKLLILHLIIGLVGFYFRFLFFAFPVLAIIFGFYTVAKNRNENNEVLYFAAYFVGIECFFRMTKCLYFYETGKYAVMIFMILGMLFKKFSDKSAIYIITLILFVPGIVVALSDFGAEAQVREQIAFNMSGPMCLVISSIYCYERVITSTQLKNILLSFIIPLVSMSVFLVLYNPSNHITNVEANSANSGGFGPNQVATILGFGSFCAFALFLFFSRSVLQRVVFLALSAFLIYRSLITFSRGGTYTGAACIILLMLFTFPKASLIDKFKIQTIAFLAIVAGIFIFSYTTYETDGFILKRYKGQDGLGKEKEDKFSGREDIAKAEIEIFKQSPITGCGIGLNLETKKKNGATYIGTHNEVTRLLAEQGVFGILIFFILLFTPLIYYFWNREQVFLICLGLCA
jgi:O-antigen ligase